MKRKRYHRAWVAWLLAAALLCASPAAVFAEGEMPASGDDSVPMAPVSVAEALQTPYVEGELIVKFKDGVNPYSAASANDSVVSDSVTVDGTDTAGEITAIALPPGGTVATELSKWRKDPLVQYAEPNYIYTADAAPNDPEYVNQWYIPQVKADKVWATSTGTGIIVAVIDTGVQTNHPDLVGRLLTGYKPQDGSTDVEDTQGHGTHVAGTIAATANNAAGISGVAPNVQILPIKGLAGANGEGSSIDIIKGIKYAADHNARIINMSLGSSQTSQAEQDAVNYAYNKGVLVIAAAGNSKTSKPHYPASLNNVMSVVALDEQNKKASFSNYGSKVDISAPGTNIVSTFLGGIYKNLQGTSMATPIVSGVAALVLSHRPTLTPDGLEALLETTAVDLGTKGRDNNFGYGLIDAEKALTGIVDNSPIRLIPGEPNPSPFAPSGKNSAKIGFSIAKPASITMKVYDDSDTLVKTLLNGALKKAGSQFVAWNGKNDSNVLVESGTYTYQISAADGSGNSSDVMAGTIEIDRSPPVFSNVEASGTTELSVSYDLSEDATVTATVLSGKKAVKTIKANEPQEAGSHFLSWDGKLKSGAAALDGLYILRLSAVDSLKNKAQPSDTSFYVEGQLPALTKVSAAPSSMKIIHGAGKSIIKYTLSEPASVTVAVYNGNNDVVRTLVNNVVTESGARSVEWEGKDDNGAVVKDGTYTYNITAIDAGENKTEAAGTIVTDSSGPVITALTADPSPFSPTGSNTMNINFSMSENAKVSILIYNNQGKPIKTLVKSVAKSSGSQSFTWNGKISATKMAPVGTYFVKVAAVDALGFSSLTESPTFTVQWGAPGISAVSGPTIVKLGDGNSIPIKYTLSRNALVSVQLFDRGNMPVRSLLTYEPLLQGVRSVVWDGKNDNGETVAPGEYTFKITASDAGGMETTVTSGSVTAY